MKILLGAYFLYAIAGCAMAGSEGKNTREHLFAEMKNAGGSFDYISLKNIKGLMPAGYELRQMMDAQDVISLRFSPRHLRFFEFIQRGPSEIGSKEWYYRAQDISSFDSISEVVRVFMDDACQYPIYKGRYIEAELVKRTEKILEAQKNYWLGYMLVSAMSSIPEFLEVVRVQNKSVFFDTSSDEAFSKFISHFCANVTGMFLKEKTLFEETINFLKGENYNAMCSFLLEFFDIFKGNLTTLEDRVAYMVGLLNDKCVAEVFRMYRQYRENPNIIKLVISTDLIKNFVSDAGAVLYFKSPFASVEKRQEVEIRNYIDYFIREMKKEGETAGNTPKKEVLKENKYSMHDVDSMLRPYDEETYLLVKNLSSIVEENGSTVKNEENRENAEESELDSKDESKKELHKEEKKKNKKHRKSKEDKGMSWFKKKLGMKSSDAKKTDASLDQVDNVTMKEDASEDERSEDRSTTQDTNEKSTLPGDSYKQESIADDSKSKSKSTVPNATEILSLMNIERQKKTDNEYSKHKNKSLPPNATASQDLITTEARQHSEMPLPSSKMKRSALMMEKSTRDADLMYMNDYERDGPVLVDVDATDMRNSVAQSLGYNEYGGVYNYAEEQPADRYTDTSLEINRTVSRSQANNPLINNDFSNDAYLHSRNRYNHSPASSVSNVSERAHTIRNAKEDVITHSKEVLEAMEGGESFLNEMEETNRSDVYVWDSNVFNEVYANDIDEIRENNELRTTNSSRQSDRYINVAGVDIKFFGPREGVDLKEEVWRRTAERNDERMKNARSSSFPDLAHTTAFHELSS
ncbi:hypothetical protein NEMIN01_1668 [Nematocida minor]|uniref:uncharacterized protein n=1 Tax=Nematocida minor TaxID=1912983 RepID=UPI00221E83E0|nr:uncharacterized protein NEMIN01_1668 [Nematocida minor]KAI5191777.1 hypothetical protein NEMIN01_1668 [Nematocida minor]